jgi:drug/metabolite transporter (DMT)-like permease
MPISDSRIPYLSGLSSLLPKTQGSIFPFLALGLIVLASAAQTEVAHNLTSNIGYNQPYFTFYLTHITFTFIFPLHLLYLRLTTSVSTKSHIDAVRSVIAIQLKHHPLASWKRIAMGWSAKITWLTLLISVPALSWFVAMLFTSAIDITAIYASSAFWAYLFAMLLLGQPLSRVTIGSIGLAFVGVVVLSVDGMGESVPEEGGVQVRGRAFGDMVMMFGKLQLLRTQ